MRSRKSNDLEVINYYQSSQWLYRLFVYNRRTLGMHFGFWQKNTPDRQEAILNENREIIRVAKIRKGMRVLDAGCGVGGTAIFIAQETGAKVWGITLDPRQVVLAKSYARQRGLTHLLSFSTQDYTKTKFPANFFDVIYGIESVCYASPKSKFLKEAYRLLAPGGKLIIADGYLAREPKTAKELQLVADFNWTFVLSEMVTAKELARQMAEVGFGAIETWDKIEEVRPSVSYFRSLGGLTGIFCELTKYIPLKPIQAIYQNYLAFKKIGEFFKLGLADYVVHSGTKI